MHLRGLTLFAAAVLAAAPAAAAAGGISTQREHAARVETQIAAVNARLERVVNDWEGARVELADVNSRLRANTARLRIARANLNAAQIRIEHRLAQLYVSGNPTAVDVLAGAKSISDLIDRIEAAQVLSAQDASIGHQAARFQDTIARREALLVRQRRARASAVARLAANRAAIARDLATQRRLLASIHKSIRTLVAQQAARERRIAREARERIARQVALARRQAAAQVVTPAATAALPAPPAAPSPAEPAPAPAPAPAAPTAAPPVHESAASIAARYLGVPYVWGGSSPSGFDCSGLVAYVYAQLGVSLPHYTVAQWNATLPISTTSLQPGDLVFFDGLGHVGIYIGGGQFIHAPHTGTVVQIASLSGYWIEHLDGARRVP